MSSRISIGRPLESTGRPVELLYRTSPKAEDLAHCVLGKIDFFVFTQQAPLMLPSQLLDSTSL